MDKIINSSALLDILAAFLLSPLAIGVVSRTKAFFAGRNGQPVVQPYWDILKLFRKGAVYSASSTWVFKASPVIGMAAVLLASAFMPQAGRALLAFPGDFLVLVYLLALARLFMVAAAVDTASSFCAMGASREVQYAAMAEPALLLGISALAVLSGSFSLSGCFAAIAEKDFVHLLPVLLLLAAAFMLVFLVENCRVPFDDPNTHLELTMIHEVMALDNGGPDFGLIQWTAALKFWLLGSIVVQTLVPFPGDSILLEKLCMVGCMILLAIAVGVIESTVARMRLLRVPQLLTMASALAVIAMIFASR